MASQVRGSGVGAHRTERGLCSRGLSCPSSPLPLSSLVLSDDLVSAQQARSRCTCSRLGYVCFPKPKAKRGDARDIPSCRNDVRTGKQAGAQTLLAPLLADATGVAPVVGSTWPCPFLPQYNLGRLPALGPHL